MNYCTIQSSFGSAKPMSKASSPNKSHVQLQISRRVRYMFDVDGGCECQRKSKVYFVICSRYVVYYGGCSIGTISENPPGTQVAYIYKVSLFNTKVHNFAYSTCLSAKPFIKMYDLPEALWRREFCKQFLEDMVLVRTGDD